MNKKELINKLKVKPVVNKANGQINICIPKKKVRKEVLENINNKLLEISIW